MVTNEYKEKIRAALAARRANFDGSDARFAATLGIGSAQYSRIKRGETVGVLADEKWISIARRLGVGLTDAPAWQTAETPVFKYITAQLEMCQQNGLSAMLCDLTDIGKTYTARQYVKTHRNAVYVDCSQVKTRQKLLRGIAREFGVVARDGWQTSTTTSCSTSKRSIGRWSSSMKRATSAMRLSSRSKPYGTPRSTAAGIT